MTEKLKEELSFSDKMDFLTLARDHYKDKYEMYGTTKSAVIDLFIKSVEILLRQNEVDELTDKEMLDLMYEVFTLDYIEELKGDGDKNAEHGVETGIGMLVGVIENDKELMLEELNEIENNSSEIYIDIGVHCND